MKTCTKCDVCKPLSDFGRRSKSKDGLNYWCKACMSSNAKKWKQENPDKHLNKEAKYLEKNREKRKRNQAAYFQKHKVRLRDVQNAAYARRMEDPLQKMKTRTRNRIAQIYHNGEFKKSQSTNEMIGCTWEQLHSHLISTALSRYGIWCAYDKYEIDHIIPIMTATTEEEIIALNHYSNLQLLTPEDHKNKTKEDIKLYKMTYP